MNRVRYPFLSFLGCLFLLFKFELFSSASYCFFCNCFEVFMENNSVQ